MIILRTRTLNPDTVFSIPSSVFFGIWTTSTGIRRKYSRCNHLYRRLVTRAWRGASGWKGWCLVARGGTRRIGATARAGASPSAPARQQRAASFPHHRECADIACILPQSNRSLGLRTSERNVSFGAPPPGDVHEALSLKWGGEFKNQIKINK